MNRRTALLIGAIAVVALVGFQLLPSLHPSAGSAKTALVTTYTCCTTQDVDTVRHPGESFQIHWAPVTQAVPLTEEPVTITLAASLSGNYASAEELKSDELSRASTPPIRVVAPAVTVSSAVRGAPVSIITIPRAAPPGLYNLTTSWTSGGVTSSGSSVIRVEPA